MAFYKSYSNAMDSPSRLKTRFSALGSPTSPMVAKQLEEFGKSLNQGVRNVEIGTIQAEKFDFIPKEHFDEIRRLAKLTDSNVSVHAPLLDLAGFPTQGEGGAWSDEKRKSTESQVFSILERTHMLSKSDKEKGIIDQIPVVFHAGHTFSQEYEKGLKKVKLDEHGNQMFEKYADGRPNYDKPVMIDSDIRVLAAVNRDTGQVRPINYEEKEQIGGRKIIYDPFYRLKVQNSTEWDQEKLKLLDFQKQVEDIKEKLSIKIKQNEAIIKSGLINDESYVNTFRMNNLDISRMQNHISEINVSLHSGYHEIYGKFNKFAEPKKQEEFKDAREKLNKEYNEIQTKLITPLMIQQRKLEEEYAKNPDDPQKVFDYQNAASKLIEAQAEQAKAIVNKLYELPDPNLWVPVKDFAIEKTTETVSNSLAKLYMKLKKEGKEKETPFITLENFFVNAPMSRADDLRLAVEESRRLLAEKLVKEGVNKKEAENAANSLVSATWDTGHINNLRKAGWEGEELKKEVIEETKKIADLVRHVHITDNFGFFDSHLPPGMGNVPMKEIMEELEKKWADLERKGIIKPGQHPRSIVEAGGFVAEIGPNPTVSVLEFFGSPLYNDTVQGGPYWGGGGGAPIPVERRVGFSYSPYREGFVEFPQQHFNMYGSSFTTLPKSVGGQVGGDASRFSGTPNQ
ncbi:sugar phosphate isomerase/epimerase [Candidatus Woesearchaeota archaeon]|nr:MAG: hypothetical protein QT09_C0006G0012 [archaeon GW2011_AR18]MBS3161711.1 sugar phosphate isomerase/epimerase [Candidatus Woesearchaeota archaeon]HIH25722.1 sugar phosphate isomerase/epimerase [Nanoarchaeota archaeon]